METNRIMELAGVESDKVIQMRAKRLADEILSASVPLVERTKDVLQNLDPIKDKIVRDKVVENVLGILKIKIA